jgi:cytochrome c oxidase assembly protein subunit 15
MHSFSVIVLMLFTIAFYFRKDVCAITKKRILIFFAISLSQGAIGYIQYFLGVPELLVGMHLIGTTLVWIAAWRIWLSVQFKTKEISQ